MQIDVIRKPIIGGKALLNSSISIPLSLWIIYYANTATTLGIWYHSNSEQSLDLTNQ